MAKTLNFWLLNKQEHWEHLTVHSAGPAETPALRSRFKQRQSNIAVWTCCYINLHYCNITKKLQVKAITDRPLCVLNWSNANLTCYYSLNKTSPPNTLRRTPLLHTQTWSWIAAGCAGDDNAGRTDPLHLRNIGKSHTERNSWIINGVCRFWWCLGKSEQIVYEVHEADSAKHNGTEQEVIKAFQANGESRSVLKA